MYKRMGLAIALIVFSSAPAKALDLSPLVGTMEVQFQPMQSAGIVEGCTLVYRVIGQDYAYRNGNLVGLTGNIAYHRNNDRTAIGLSLKIGLRDILDNKAPMETHSSLIYNHHTERQQEARLVNLMENQAFGFLPFSSMKT